MYEAATFCAQRWKKKKNTPHGKKLLQVLLMSCDISFVKTKKKKKTQTIKCKCNTFIINIPGIIIAHSVADAGARTNRPCMKIHVFHGFEKCVWRGYNMMG